MLHPIHAKLHQARAQDWSVIDNTGQLPCGVCVQWHMSDAKDGTYVLDIATKTAQDQTWTFFDTCLIDEEDLPYNSDFLTTWAFLQGAFHYDALLPLYRRVQRALIERGVEGPWMVMILNDRVLIRPQASDAFLDLSQWPEDLLNAIGALEHALLPPFGDHAHAAVGQFLCIVPSCAHARLEILHA